MKRIENLIKGGESQVLDFKFEISSAQKIAKTLVAFANTDGGTLLIGVKDNGVIAGIRTNEEVFMIDLAASMYCRPKIKYKIEQWNIRGRLIVEVYVFPNPKKQCKAKDVDNKWKAYVRVSDSNFIADRVLVRAWKEKYAKPVKIEYSRKESFLLNYLKDYNKITFSEFCEKAEISEKTAENILVDFYILGLIDIQITEKSAYYINNV